jgi:hypothetical protein
LWFIFGMVDDELKIHKIWHRSCKLRRSPPMVEVCDFDPKYNFLQKDKFSPFGRNDEMLYVAMECWSGGFAATPALHRL